MKIPKAVLLIREHPTEAIQAGSMLLWVLALLGIISGKILDRVVIAPDVGLCLFVMFLGFHLMAIVANMEVVIEEAPVDPPGGNP